jgi:hypothetical protein
VVEISFLSLSFLSLEDALFLLCPWFSHEVFYTVMCFNEASEDTGISVAFYGVCVSPSLPGVFCTRGSVRFGRPEH